MTEELTPKWAVELLLEFRQVKTEITAHTDWATRNIKDLELRMRKVEALNLSDHPTRIRQLEQFKWILVGVALASGSVGGLIVKALGA